jgi:hypothetical protein
MDETPWAISNDTQPPRALRSSVQNSTPSRLPMKRWMRHSESPSPIPKKTSTSSPMSPVRKLFNRRRTDTDDNLPNTPKTPTGRSSVHTEGAILVSAMLQALKSQGNEESPSLHQRLMGYQDPVTGRWETITTSIFLIHPRSQFMVYWNFLLAFFILVCVVYIPFQVAFAYKANAFWVAFNPLMDAFFVTDIFINFVLAYYDDGELVQGFKVIARNYLRTWFVIDFISTYNFLVVFALNMANVKLLSNLRILRLFRLFKLLNVVKLRKLNFNSFKINDSDDMHWTKTLTKIMIIFLKLSFVCHLMGCSFYFIAHEAEAAGERNWVSVYFEEKGHEEDLVVLYEAALYWAFVTVTTVGYGDINPTNGNERAFVGLMTFVGSATSAIIIHEMAVMSSTKAPRVVQYESRMASIEDMFRFYELPKELRQQARGYLRKTFDLDYFKSEGVMDHLSYDIRNRISAFVTKTSIKRLPFFKKAPDEMMAKVVHSVKQLLFKKGDVVYKRGVPRMEHLYFLAHGELMATISLKNEDNGDSSRRTRYSESSRESSRESPPLESRGASVGSSREGPPYDSTAVGQATVTMGVGATFGYLHANDITEGKVIALQQSEVFMLRKPSHTLLHTLYTHYTLTRYSCCGSQSCSSCTRSSRLLSSR